MISIRNEGNSVLILIPYSSHTPAESPKWRKANNILSTKDKTEIHKKQVRSSNRTQLKFKAPTAKRLMKTLTTPLTSFDKQPTSDISSSIHEECQN